MSIAETGISPGRSVRHGGRAPSVALLLALLGAAGCENVQVTTVEVAQVEVEPAATSVVAGRTARLEATVQGPDGSDLNGREVWWSSSDEAVATVDADGTVTGRAPGAATISARVEGITGSAAVEVLPGPGILLDRTEVAFAAPRGGADPPSQSVSVENSGAGDLTGLSAEVEYTDGGASGWLSASLTRSHAPTTLTLRVETGSLPEETYTARVRIRGEEASAEVTVTFAVGDPEPRIGLDRTEVELRATLSRAAPDPAEVRIHNAGGQSLTGLGASVDYQMGGSGWLATSLTPSTAPAALNLRADQEGLAPGMHVAVVTVVSPVAANSPREVLVTFIVSEPPPSIDLERTSVELSATEGGSDPEPTEVEIANGGGGSLVGLSASITWDEGAEGWLDVQLDRDQAPATLTLTPSTSGLDAGDYSATVEVSASGADGPATLDVALTVQEPENQPPEADFTADCTLLVCTFRDRSEDPDGEIQSRQWDFGDGATSTDGEVQHVYVLPGTYTVTLTVTDDDGATDEASQEVSVIAPENSPPEASFQVSCDHLECAFQDGSTDEDGQVEAWAWEFGDGGESSERNPSHAYGEPGSYTVTLEVTDDDGATARTSQEVAVVAPANVPPEAWFDVTCDGLDCDFQDRSTDEDGQVVGWSWDFGDGRGSSSRDPSHRYDKPGTYVVTLEVTDDGGATDRASLEVTATPANSNSPPTAAFEVDCDDDDLECDFKDRSWDDDGKIVSRLWSFGDGETSTQRNPEHEYDESGTYTVRLTVTDDEGATDSAEESVTVKDDD